MLLKSLEKSVIINMDDTTVKRNVYGGGLSNENENLEVFEDTNGFQAPKSI